MTRPQSKRKLQNPFEKPSVQISSKAYLRNFGKGKLKFADDALKFYQYSGRLTKKKSLAKLIPLAKIEKVTLVSDELNVTSQGITESFVINDKAFAQFVYLKTNEFLSQPEESKETQIPSTIEAPAKQQLGQTLDVSLSIIDSLFDGLMCLQGRVDWNQITNHVKKCEEDVKKIDKGIFETVNLDFSVLFSAATDRNVESFTKEAYRLLETLHGNFQGIAPEFLKAKNVVTSYYILNDTMLAVVVGDANVEDELTQLSLSLADLSKDIGLNAIEVVNPMNNLLKEKQKDPYAQEARAIFKKQVAAAMAK